MQSSNYVSESKFLRALKCTNFNERPPIWIMRQAGRYLPEYQKIRKNHSLEEMFRTPKIIFEVTKQPVEILGVDAAILFADILHIPLTLGCKVTFSKTAGPVVDCPAVFKKLNIKKTLSYVYEGILLLKKELSVPLIGFCGGPFTVMKYMVGKKIIYTNPKKAHQLLQLITDQSIDYLKMQESAGVDAIQIFESWASTLSHDDFCCFALPYLKKIINALSTPVILFSRGSCHLVSELVSVRPNGISFDWFTPLHKIRKKVPKTVAIQGNLDPEILYASQEKILEKTEKLLSEMEGDPGFIVNLGHGLLPDMCASNVKYFVDCIKSYSPGGCRGHRA